jgi:CHAT domain-containing protein
MILLITFITIPILSIEGSDQTFFQKGIASADKRDYASAISWFEKAWYQGDQKAENKLLILFKDHYVRGFEVYDKLADYKKAQHYFELSKKSAKPILKTIHSNKHDMTTYITMLRFYAMVLDELGKTDEALDMFEHALNESEYYLKDKNLETSIYNEWFVTLDKLQRYSEILDRWSRVDPEAISDPFVKTALMQTHAISLRETGNFDQAKQAFMRALFLCKNNLHLDEKHYTLLLAAIYNNLGRTIARKHMQSYINTNGIQDKVSFKEALKNYNASLKTLKSISLSQNMEFKRIEFANYNDKGIYFDKLKDYEEAKKWHHKAEKIVTDYHIGDTYASNAYTSLAITYGNLKQCDLALQYLNKVPKATRSYNYHTVAAQIKTKYLTSLEPQQRSEQLNEWLPEIEKDYQAAFDQFQKHKIDTFLALNQSEQEKFIKQFQHIYKLWLRETNSLHQFNKDPVRGKEFFSRWINFKGSIQEYQIALHKVKQQHTRTANLFTQLHDLKKTPSKNQQEARQLQRNINKLAQQYIPNDISIKQLQNALPDKKTLYIDFAQAFEHDYHIFMLDGAGNITIEHIDEEYGIEIDKLIAAIRDDFNNHSRGVQQLRDNEEKETKKIKERLYRIYSYIFSYALEQKLNQYDTLVISPDGLLNFLPFEALVKANQTYLIEQFKIQYTTSAKDLVRLSKATSNTTHIVSVAKPRFDMKNLDKHPIKSKTETLGGYCKNLKEVDKIDSHISEALLKMEPLKLHDKNALEEKLSKLTDVKLLDIVTHGLYCNGLNVSNPMLKTMLLLSGANQTIKKQKGKPLKLLPNDGILTALEITDLNLLGTKLVNLSACETGLGTIQSAEGVSSINKAFIQAGAQNVISSLWPLAQTETAQIQESFYKKGSFIFKDPSDVLANVKKELLVKRHPYFWAGLVLYGQ